MTLLCGALFAQTQPRSPMFDVASVRQSKQMVGPDYNNQIRFAQDGIYAQHATLKRLISEAWDVQVNQVQGPAWLAHNEYDISARSEKGVTREQIALMLRSLLTERFKLHVHTEARKMPLYELTVSASGPKIHPNGGEPQTAGGPGFHFHGDMRHLADLLAVQFSIPPPQNPSEPVRAGGAPILVEDKTGLKGIYDFSVDIRPEPNTDMFTAWQRVLHEQLGLKIEHRVGSVSVVVIDDGVMVPTEN